MCFKIGDNNKVDLIIYCIDGILKVINTKIISVELKIDIGIDQRKIFYDRERHVLFSLDLENNLMCWDLEKKCILKTMNMAGVLDIHFFHEQNLILVQSKNGVFSKMSFENIERTPSFEIIFCFEEIMNVLKLEKRSTIELKQIMLHENLFFILLSGGWFVVINFKGEVVFFYNIKDANCFDIFFHDSCKSYIAFGLTKGSCKIFKNDNASYSNFSLSGIIQIAKQTKPVNHVYLLKQSDMCFFVQDEKTKSKIFILKKSPSEEVEIIEK